MAIVYKLTSPLNKIYIGWTDRPNRRFVEHKSSAKTGSNLVIHKAIRKYGFENFKQEILFEGTNEECWNKEIEYIKSFDSIKNGYNISTGGECGSIGYVHSLEQRKHHSEMMKGRTGPNKGKLFSKEWRKALSESHRGIVPSIECRRKRSIAMKNVIRSEEWCKNISEGQRGRKQSQESILKRTATRLLNNGGVY